MTCPNCNSDSLVQISDSVRNRKFQCTKCFKKFETKSKVDVIKPPAPVKDVKPKHKFKCGAELKGGKTCQSRIAIEDYSYPEGLYTVKWNMELKAAPEAFQVVKDNKLLYMSTSCGECNRELLMEDQYILDKEIEEKYGIK